MIILEFFAYILIIIWDTTMATLTTLFGVDVALFVAFVISSALIATPLLLFKWR